MLLGQAAAHRRDDLALRGELRHLTVLGGARNPLALGILRQHYDLSITFVEWLTAVAPFSIALMICAYLLLVRDFGIDVSDVDGDQLCQPRS